MALFVSYPKSGRTWVRFMLNTYLCRLHELSLQNVFDVEKHPAVPYPVQWTHFTAAMLQQLPYYSMSRGNWAALQGQDAVLLTRDPVSTMASAYQHAVHRINVFTGTPKQFLRDPRFGVIKLVTLYNIWDELAAVLGRRTELDYAAVMADPLRAMKQIIAFLHLDRRDDLLEVAVVQGSFDNMKALSTSPAYAGSVLAPKDASDPRTYKVRVGGSSDSRELFDDDDRQYIAMMMSSLRLARTMTSASRASSRRLSPACSIGHRRRVVMLTTALPAGAMIRLALCCRTSWLNARTRISIDPAGTPCREARPRCRCAKRSSTRKRTFSSTATRCSLTSRSARGR